MLTLITAPTVKPLTVADVSAQVRYDVTPESALIETYISAVTAKAEVALRRQLLTATWNLTLDAFPSASTRNPFAAIYIPLPPLQTVLSVKYLSPLNTLITLDPSLYAVAMTTPGLIIPVYGQTWPDTLRFHGAVQIQFTAGYGNTADKVPECIKAWCMLNVASLYENRESQNVAEGRLTEIDLTTMADSLLDPERWEVRV